MNQARSFSCMILVCAILSWHCSGEGDSTPTSTLPNPNLTEIAPASARLIETALGETKEVIESGVSPEEKGDAWGELGMMFQAYLFRNEAATCYEVARSLNAKDYRWWYLLGRMYQGMGRQDEGAVELEHSLELNSDFTPAVVALAEYYRKRNRTQEAADLFDRALNLDSKSVIAMAGLAQIELASNRAENALRWLDQAIAIQPNASVLHYQRGRALQKLGRDNEASQSFAERSRRFDPIHIADPLLDAVATKKVSSASRVAAADAALQSGRFQEAITILQDLVEGDPLNFALRVKFGSALLRVNRPDDALTQFQEAVSLNPNAASVFYNIGGLLSRSGQFVEAIAAFEKAFSLDETMWEAELARADSVRRLGDLAKAAGIYSTVRQASIENQNLRVSIRLASAIGRALCFAGAGDSGLALANVEADLAQLGRDPVLAHIKARLLAVVPKNQPENGRQALDILSRLRAQGVTLELVESAAMALAAVGRFDEAVNTQEEAIRLATANSRENLLPILRENLKAYQAGRQVAVAWSTADPLLDLPSYRR